MLSAHKVSRDLGILVLFCVVLATALLVFCVKEYPKVPTIDQVETLSPSKVRESIRIRRQVEFVVLPALAWAFLLTGFGIFRCRRKVRSLIVDIR